MKDSTEDSSYRQLALIANRLCDSHSRKDRAALHRMLRIIVGLLGSVKPTIKERENLVRVLEKCSYEEFPEMEWLGTGAKHVLFYHGHIDTNALAKHVAWGDVVEDVNMEVVNVTHASMEG